MSETDIILSDGQNRQALDAFQQRLANRGFVPSMSRFGKALIGKRAPGVQDILLATLKEMSEQSRATHETLEQTRFELKIVRQEQHLTETRLACEKEALSAALDQANARIDALSRQTFSQTNALSQAIEAASSRQDESLEALNAKMQADLGAFFSATNLSLRALEEADIKQDMRAAQIKTTLEEKLSSLQMEIDDKVNALQQSLSDHINRFLAADQASKDALAHAKAALEKTRQNDQKELEKTIGAKTSELGQELREQMRLLQQADDALNSALIAQSSRFETAQIALKEALISAQTDIEATRQNDLLKLHATIETNAGKLSQALAERVKELAQMDHKLEQAFIEQAHQQDVHHRAQRENLVKVQSELEQTRQHDLATLNAALALAMADMRADVNGEVAKLQAADENITQQIVRDLADLHASADKSSQAFAHSLRELADTQDQTNQETSQKLAVAEHHLAQTKQELQNQHNQSAAALASRFDELARADQDLKQWRQTIDVATERFDIGLSQTQESLKDTRENIAQLQDQQSLAHQDMIARSDVLSHSLKDQAKILETVQTGSQRAIETTKTELASLREQFSVNADQANVRLEGLENQQQKQSEHFGSALTTRTLEIEQLRQDSATFNNRFEELKANLTRIEAHLPVKADENLTHLQERLANLHTLMDDLIGQTSATQDELTDLSERTAMFGVLEANVDYLLQKSIGLSNFMNGSDVKTQGFLDTVQSINARLDYFLDQSNRVSMELYNIQRAIGVGVGETAQNYSAMDYAQLLMLRARAAMANLQVRTVQKIKPRKLKLSHAQPIEEAFARLGQHGGSNLEQYRAQFDPASAQYVGLPAGSIMTSGNDMAAKFADFLSLYLVNSAATLDIGSTFLDEPVYLTNAPFETLSRAFTFGDGPANGDINGVVNSLPEFLPWADASFDLLVACGTWDRYCRLDLGIDEAWRVLVPGGHFVGCVILSDNAQPFDVQILESTGQNAVETYQIGLSWFEPFMHERGFALAELMVFELPFRYALISFKKKARTAQIGDDPE